MVLLSLCLSASLSLSLYPCRRILYIFRCLWSYSSLLLCIFLSVPSSSNGEFALLIYMFFTCASASSSGWDCFRLGLLLIEIASDCDCFQLRLLLIATTIAFSFVSSFFTFFLLMLFLFNQSTDSGREEAEMEKKRLQRDLESRCRELELEKQASDKCIVFMPNYERRSLASSESLARQFFHGPRVFGQDSYDSVCLCPTIIFFCTKAPMPDK